MSTQATDLARIRETAKKSREGEAGLWRREFFNRYRQVLEHIFDETRDEIRPYLNSTEESISCRKGCAHCCEHFVSVSVSHALVVTDYLVANEKAISSFLHSYENWIGAIEANPPASAIFHILEESTASSAMVKPSSQEMLGAYHSFSIPCPFLDHGQCAIYPVRPICCAAYFSVSSPDYCRSDSATLATIFEVAPSQANLRKMAKLADPRFFMHQENLPTLVYKLLVHGLPDVAIGIQKLFDAQEVTQARNS
jgi:Fe-S-cluster containining protein